MTDTTSLRGGATKANWAWAWAQAYAELSKIPLSQIKGDLYKALHTRTAEICLASRPQPTQNPGEMAVVEEFASGTANRRPTGPKLRMTDEQMRNEWCSAGGDMHGPITETVVMPLADYLNFRRDLDAKTVALAECVSRLKLRIIFIGGPGESYWSAGNDKYDWWLPDWRYEIALIENVLHGSPVDQPEKPTDTKRLIELKTAAQRGYRNLPSILGSDDTYPEGPHTQDYVAGYNKALAQITEALRANVGSPQPAAHVLYEKGDTDAPESIKDRNGDIVLGLCKRCGAAEADLIEPCVTKPENGNG